MAPGKPRRCKASRNNKGGTTEQQDAKTRADMSQFKVIIVIPDHEKAAKNDYTQLQRDKAKTHTVFDGISGMPLTGEEHRQAIRDWHNIRGPDGGICNECTRLDAWVRDAKQTSEKPTCHVHGPETFAKTRSWYECIFAQLKSSEGSVVAQLAGSLIRRADIQSAFHQEMDHVSDLSTNMAYHLFNRYGQLQDEHKTTGSRIWDDKLDHGDIFIIEMIHVDKEWRRKGLGTHLCQTTIAAAKAKCNPKTFVTMAKNKAIDENADPKDIRANAKARLEASYKLQAESKRFLQSLGYRRVGTSAWFAMSGDEDHACHTLSISDDWDHAMYGNSMFGTHVWNFCATALFGDLPDNQCVALLNANLAAHGVTDKNWRLAGTAGNTILHCCAFLGKTACVRWVLEKFPELAEARNDQGHTPLECCIQSMDLSRNHILRRGDQTRGPDEFTGHAQDFIDTVCVLKNLKNPSQTQLERIKFGCKCDQCLRGFFSPRMNHILLSCATRLGHVLEGTRQRPVQDLPESVQAFLPKDKAMLQHFGRMVRSFAMCLMSSQIPSDANIQRIITMQQLQQQEAMKPLTVTPSMAACAVFEWARLTSPISGDGSGLDAEGALAYDALPKCRNDEDFFFVLVRCGFKRVDKVKEQRQAAITQARNMAKEIAKMSDDPAFARGLEKLSDMPSKQIEELQEMLEDVLESSDCKTQ